MNICENNCCKIVYCSVESFRCTAFTISRKVNNGLAGSNMFYLTTLEIFHFFKISPCFKIPGVQCAVNLSWDSSNM